MQFLDLLDIPNFDALGEADSECVSLFKMGKCDGVISNDTDIFVYALNHVPQ